MWVRPMQMHRIREAEEAEDKKDGPRYIKIAIVAPCSSYEIVESLLLCPRSAGQCCSVPHGKMRNVLLRGDMTEPQKDKCLYQDFRSLSKA